MAFRWLLERHPKQLMDLAKGEDARPARKLWLCRWPTSRTSYAVAAAPLASVALCETYGHTRRQIRCFLRTSSTSHCRWARLSLCSSFWLLVLRQGRTPQRRTTRCIEAGHRTARSPVFEMQTAHGLCACTTSIAHGVEPFAMSSTSMKYDRSTYIVLLRD